MNFYELVSSFYKKIHLTILESVSFCHINIEANSLEDSLAKSGFCMKAYGLGS